MKDFQPMNNIDFIEAIYLFIGSVFIMSRIINKDRFVENLEAFFVFFGLILYSFLQILSTIMLSFDFFRNFNFALFATLITMLFWLVSVPWIRRLKSRLI